jgi:conjugal transfer mating pair stabilization protein TraG
MADPYPDVNTFLPREGLGYKTYSRDERRWGKASTIEALKTIAINWHTKYSDTPIYIGNISRKGGGDLPPHKSHKKGIDVDIRPIRFKNNGLPVTWKDADYDREKTGELIKLIKDSYPIQYIFFNDPELIKRGLCTFCAGHDDHLHIRFNF